jgi:hypothetical protein
MRMVVLLMIHWRVQENKRPLSLPTPWSQKWERIYLSYTYPVLRRAQK